jgi:DNA-binding transcriptional MerR regulator
LLHFCFKWHIPPKAAGTKVEKPPQAVTSNKGENENLKCAPSIRKIFANFDFNSSASNMALNQIAFDFDDMPAPKPPPPKKVAKPAVPVPVAAPTVVTKAKSTRGRKSLKAAAATAAMVQVPPDEELFTKLYYGMGQVAAMFGITPSLLRMWENEFSVLQPRKNGKGDRLFRPEDIKMLQLIHHLLRERKYTIQGAKEYLRANARAAEKSTLIAELKQLKSFLNELKASL